MAQIEHHERIYGSGYPNGLTGDNMLLESRIMAIETVSQQPFVIAKRLSGRACPAHAGWLHFLFPLLERGIKGDFFICHSGGGI